MPISSSEPSFAQSLSSRRRSTTPSGRISSLRALRAIPIRCRTSAIIESSIGNKRGSPCPRLPKQESRPRLHSEYGVSSACCIPMTSNTWPWGSSERSVFHRVRLPHYLCAESAADVESRNRHHRRYSALFMQAWATLRRPTRRPPAVVVDGEMDARPEPGLLHLVGARREVDGILRAKRP